MAFAGLGVIALDIANVDEFGDDGNGELGGRLRPELETNGTLDVFPLLLGEARRTHDFVDGAVLSGAAHHPDVMSVAALGPYAALGVVHVATRQHAHVIGWTGGVPIERGEVLRGQQDALDARKTSLVEICRVIVDDGDIESDMRGKLGELDGNVRGAEQPDAHGVEERDACPGESLELFVMHRGTTRDVLHLKDVTIGYRARADDLLGIVAKEKERVAIGRTDIAVLLGDGVVDVVHGKGRIVDDLEAEPGEVALVDGTHGTLERGDIRTGERGHDRIERGR